MYTLISQEVSDVMGRPPVSKLSFGDYKLSPVHQRRLDRGTIMMDHNYAGCQIELCEPCYHYAMGYSDGKAKGFHPRDCGCAPCTAFKDRLKMLVDAR